MTQTIFKFEPEVETAAKVYILHDAPEWVAPLGKALDAVGVDHEFWYMKDGLVPLHEEPPQGIFYNRIGASAHTRGHGHAPELARLTLTWLENAGRRVINNVEALGLELSKLNQYQSLHRAGIRTPKTVAAVGDEKLVEAAAKIAPAPFIIKPNRGGKGLGVHQFDTLAELEAFLAEPHEKPVDGIWLVQEYIKAPTPFVIRSEFVGGKFLYAMKVNTEEGFQLCPAESCSIQDMLHEKFKHTDAYNDHPLIKRLENYLEINSVDIAGIEFIEDADGELYVYDINTNTNYNPRAEEAAGIERGGMLAVSEYLADLCAAPAPASTYQSDAWCWSKVAV